MDRLPSRERRTICCTGDRRGCRCGRPQTNRSSLGCGGPVLAGWWLAPADRELAPRRQTSCVLRPSRRRARDHQQRAQVGVNWKLCVGRWSLRAVHGIETRGCPSDSSKEQARIPRVWIDVVDTQCRGIEPRRHLGEGIRVDDLLGLDSEQQFMRMEDSGRAIDDLGDWRCRAAQVQPRV